MRMVISTPSSSALNKSVGRISQRRNPTLLLIIAINFSYEEFVGLRYANPTYGQGCTLFTDMAYPDTPAIH